jgi:hypothetical protein
MIRRVVGKRGLRVGKLKRDVPMFAPSEGKVVPELSSTSTTLRIHSSQQLQPIPDAFIATYIAQTLMFAKRYTVNGQLTVTHATSSSSKQFSCKT